MARNGFLTFRAHESEPDLFEKFIIIFLPMLEKFEKYVYHIENDDTPAKHIHCFFTHNYKDASKITQYFLNKDMKNLKKTFNQTTWQHAWDCQMVKDTKEDKLKALGYTVKDNVKRKYVKGYSAKELLDAVNYYILTKRIDKTDGLDNDWKYLTPKNVHINITEFCKQNNITVHDYDLIPKMVLNKTSFIQLSQKQLNLALAELKYYDNHEEESKQTIQSYGGPLEMKEELEHYRNLAEKYRKLLNQNGITYQKGLKH